MNIDPGAARFSKLKMCCVNIQKIFSKLVNIFFRSVFKFLNQFEVNKNNLGLFQ